MPRERPLAERSKNSGRGPSRNYEFQAKKPRFPPALPRHFKAPLLIGWHPHCLLIAYCLIGSCFSPSDLTEPYQGATSRE